MVRLYIRSKSSKEALCEDYPTRGEAPEALRQLVADEKEDPNGMLMSNGGGIVIRASDFNGGELREIQTGSGMVRDVR